MKALITGIGGFVGGHLAHHLDARAEAEIVGTILFPEERLNPRIPTKAHLEMIDLTDPDAVEQLLKTERPTQIYHLAAQAFVPQSFENPWKTLSNNIRSQLNILHSIVKLDLDARILIIGSGDEYGLVTPDDIPIDEATPLRPMNPYSVSKVTQDMLGLQYFLSHDVQAIRVRPFNQIGPGQSKFFVAPAFAIQIATIEYQHTEPVLYVGNTDAKRDFSDVRDMVGAYSLLMESGKPGEVYNAGSGESHSVQELLDTMLNLTNAPIEVRIDPARVRPTEVPEIRCNPSKLRDLTGWSTTTSFETSIADTLNDWRTRIR